jgi:hypothetical protein
MIYLMNSAVMPAGCYGIYRYRPATVDDLRSVLNGDHGRWESRIGYPQNIELIEQWTGVRPPLDRSPSVFKDGDKAIVMRLKYRVVPGAKGAPVSDDPRDWEFAWVEYKEEVVPMD